MIIVVDEMSLVRARRRGASMIARAHDRIETRISAPSSRVCGHAFFVSDCVVISHTHNCAIDPRWPRPPLRGRRPSGRGGVGVEPALSG
jgi:hypothetical protein